MSLTISDIAASSYAAVLADKRKAANQWAENALLNEFERQGFIKKTSLGRAIEAPLDYQANTSADILSSDTASAGTAAANTDVVTSASYTPVVVSVLIGWSALEEAENPTENQKIAFVAQLLENGINSHDDKLENKLFAASAYNGFNTLPSIITADGTGSNGGIDPATYTWWKNQFDSTGYLLDGSDMEARFTIVYDACAKGAGSALQPTLMVSGSTTHATFESQLFPLQRYVDSKDVTAGFKSIAFKNAKYIFSQYGGTKVFFANPKSLNLVVSKEMFRDMTPEEQVNGYQMMNRKIRSAVQLVTNNRSRLGVIDHA